MPIPSYYDVLNVPRNAQVGDIRHAYRRMAQRYHPDKSPDNQYAPQVMAHLNKAYEVLSDPNTRQEHDRWLAQTEAPQRPRPTIATTVSAQYISRWPWYLLFATISCAVVAIGTVAYKAALPARPAPLKAQTLLPVVGALTASDPVQERTTAGIQTASR